ncbi:ADP-ribosylglycohydrolase family protein [Saccharothrix sp. AJ9571]|nr:ADP-ribosylglycohydrolase family protein [Saccharothrix sp. AJ9571]
MTDAEARGARPSNQFADRVAGCLAGAAVADALGAPTETRTPEQIRQRYGGWVEDIVEPWHENWREARPLAPYYQGDGRITDDTLMVQAIVDAYLEKGDHLDAYDVPQYVLPRLMSVKRWIPELDKETVPLQRLFLSVKWLALRLYYGHVEPREAGVGNMMDCGAAMYAAPFGVVNAADPEAAYREAIDVTGAHQCSFAREAAGVCAAAVAAALHPEATVDSVVGECLRLAKDGTREAITAVCAAAKGCGDWHEPGVFAVLRAAMAPYDTMGEDYTDLSPLGARRPSRLHSIEELPMALGMFVLAGGAYRGTVLGGVNYGRDSDSIAAMGGAIAGALHGLSAVPRMWLSRIEAASRYDLVGPPLRLAELAMQISRRDHHRHRERERAFQRLCGAPPKP